MLGKNSSAAKFYISSNGENKNFESLTLQIKVSPNGDLSRKIFYQRGRQH